jgi:hypothetical protein
MSCSPRADAKVLDLEHYPEILGWSPLGRFEINMIYAQWLQRSAMLRETPVIVAAPQRS